MNLNSDIQLIEAARRGCVESFGILTEQYHSPVKAIAYALLGQHDLAEDVAQEVFVVACQDLAKLKRADRFGPWLAGICRNLARRTHRSQARVTCVPRAFDVQARESHEAHQLDTLRDALSQLRPGERELILLRYHDNLSLRKRGRHLIELGTRESNGQTLKGFRVEYDNQRREIWIDAQTNLFVENKVFVKRKGQWTLYRQRSITYDKAIPEHVRTYTVPKTSRIEYDWDIAPRFEAWHLHLKSITAYYQQHPLPETMALLPRQSKEQMQAHSLGRLEGITDRTGFWATPVEGSLADFLRSKIKPNGSLRVPKTLQKIELNHDLITNNGHSSHDRAVFVLNELGLELAESQEERTLWVAHYNGQTLKPWDQVVAPVPRGDARATHPGMDFSSNPTSLKHLFESFAYYQDYNLQADKIIIIDETGLPSTPEPGQPETSVAVSSANPNWQGQKCIDMARQWFLKEFGVTFTQETRMMTVYEVQHKQTILPD